MTTETLEVTPLYQEILKVADVKPDKPVKVFTYGTLKEGFGNHVVLGDSKCLGDASVIGTLYDGGIPVYSREGDDTVWGEVYEVTPETLRRLDRLEGNGFLYTRIEKEAIIVGSDAPTTVWIYEGCAIVAELRLGNGRRLPRGRWPAETA